MKRPEQQLIADYLAGEQVEEQLLAAVERDPEVLSTLAEQQAIDRQVRYALQAQSSQDFMAGLNQRLEQQPTKAKPRKLGQWYQWASVACLMVMMLVTLMIGSSTVGVIQRMVAANQAQHSWSEGQVVQVGEFNLPSGYAELELNNGVRLLLEGPVDLEIKSTKHVLLHQGSLVAHVPPQAVGFKVYTPSSYIVDLGTEFGVKVDPDGQSEVHVMTGEVKVRASTEHEFEHLTKDQARAFDLQQQVAIIQSQPQRFMRSLPGRSASNPNYLHWNFDQRKQGGFTCSGPGMTGQCYVAKDKRMIDQSPVPELVDGPFGKAMYFDGENNWLSTDYRGIGGNKPRTIAFWVKAPKDFDTLQGFGILGWGLHDVLSAWQISLNPLPVSGPLGRIRIGTNEGEIVGSTDLRDDQWHHVAIVMFGGAEADLSTHVLLYVDGELEPTMGKSLARVFTELDDPRSKPLIMGRNLAYDDGDMGKQKRFFRGALDELYVFDAALEQSQIISLMENNRLPEPTPPSTRHVANSYPEL
ncbi:LamG-like jellyroll fold domain-containing protein [Vibrio sp. WXL103]|uniref:LamG-like jellyroll fold domain-containing protein n=1 Tax=Vibrio sp. WXL103 TaxID=3450710 RepID=UPI003EC50D86